MKLNFLGAAHEVTGSATLLTVGKQRILIDCGMEQGMDIYENCELPLPPGEVDCVILTHAHIDHAGKIPALTANGFDGKIFATGATTSLCRIMLLDSAHIQAFEAEWRNRRAKRSGAAAYIPPYTVQDVANTMEKFVPCGYHTRYEILPGVSLRFLDAGHLLGSASAELTVRENGKETVLLFSGDLGNVDRPLIRDPEKPERADVVVIESTYGNRLHGERADYAAQLTAILQETFDRGGNVVIPSFAVGRTQEMLYLLREIKEQGRVSGHDGFPVYVDSPLAVEATRIYAGEEEMLPYYDEQTLELIGRGIDVLHFAGLRLAVTSQDSMAINTDKTPKVIIAASGMCEAGRIRHHLKHNLWRAESTVLFVGYQSEGTLGRALIGGAETVHLFGEEVRVRAAIRTMDGVSGHADRDMLLGWLGNLKARPQMVYVNHGADTVCDEFAKAVEERLGYPATAPYNGAEYDLTDGACLADGNRVRLEKKAAKQQRNHSVYERLRSAGDLLQTVIEQNRGGSNKDLARFESQIRELCQKWQR